MTTAYTSHVLYHLVGSKSPACHEQNFDTLRAILTSMEIRTNTVAGHSGGITFRIDPERGCVNGEPIAQTVVCFCDIPFRSLGLHTSKYGQFGVGVDRETVARWGGRPVIYIPTVSEVGAGLNNYFCLEAMNTWNGLRKHFPEPPSERVRTVGRPPTTAAETLDDASSFISQVLAFVKTFDISLPDHHPSNYYMEREWRKPANLPLHLPIREIIAPTEYHERLQAEFPQLSHLPHLAAPVA